MIQNYEADINQIRIKSKNKKSMNIKSYQYQTKGLPIDQQSQQGLEQSFTKAQFSFAQNSNQQNDDLLSYSIKPSKKSSDLGCCGMFGKSSSGKVSLSPLSISKVHLFCLDLSIQSKLPSLLNAFQSLYEIRLDLSKSEKADDRLVIQSLQTLFNKNLNILSLCLPATDRPQITSATSETINSLIESLLDLKRIEIDFNCLQLSYKEFDKLIKTITSIKKLTDVRIKLENSPYKEFPCIKRLMKMKLKSLELILPKWYPDDAFAKNYSSQSSTPNSNNTTKSNVEFLWDLSSTLLQGQAIHSLHALSLDISYWVVPKKFLEGFFTELCTIKSSLNLKYFYLNFTELVYTERRKYKTIQPQNIALLIQGLGQSFPCLEQLGINLSGCQVDSRIEEIAQPLSQMLKLEIFEMWLPLKKDYNFIDSELQKYLQEGTQADVTIHRAQ